MSKRPLISFVVLNWNGLEDTKACLDSLEKLDYPHKEIIVVDNGSTDGSKEYLAKQKSIVYVDLPKNTGFTGGHIAGRRVAKGQYVALINNDLVIDKNWAKACLETFERHDDAAAVGGRAYKWGTGNPVRNTNNEFYSYQEVYPETGETRTLLTGEEECSVDSISGAALMVKQSCLKKTGYLDDRFFAYYEETDLIARLIRVGYKAYYNPNAHTWHKVAASTEGNPAFYLYQMHRNRYFFATKNLDDLFLRRFLKNYRREIVLAALKFVARRDLDSRCRLRAYQWVRKHRAIMHETRLEVQKLGESYTDHLKSAPRNDVTVIIPCYNYGQYVSEAIDSVLSQTIQPKKIIVIDDGSTDDSRQVLDAYKDNQIVEVVHKKNSGVIDTKNLGIKMSKTYWTVFLDADDKLARTFLETTMDGSNNGEKDVVYTDMRMFGAVNDIFKALPFHKHTLLKANYINNSALIKTSLLKQVGGYKKEMSQGLEDWELYITLVEAQAVPLYLPYDLVYYRQHKGAMSRNMSSLSKEKDLQKQIKALHRNFYRAHGFYQTLLLKALVLGINLFRYPGLILVLLRALPRGILRGLSYMYGEANNYLQKKMGLV